MGQKLIIGPFTKGLKTDLEPFYIDNESFPTLINAIQWRGRVKRKRGTSYLNRPQHYWDSSNPSYTSTTTITLDGSGNGNLITGWNLDVDSSIVPGSVILTIGGTDYTDPAMDGTLSPSGTINYADGSITIAAEAGNAVSAIFFFYPTLPIMGIREFSGIIRQFPANIVFDTRYCYNLINVYPYTIYNINYYKNPPSLTYPGYTAKTDVTSYVWNGEDYQQYYTTNYMGALWASNGVKQPFKTTNIGMQYKLITNITETDGSPVPAGGLTPPVTLKITITNHGLSVGDFLYFNEIVGMTGINFQTGYVVTVVDVNNIEVEFPYATIGSPYSTGGIAQYLTNTSDPTKDCIRWYDGDPTNGNLTAPVLDNHLGWVNYCPPLSESPAPIADLPPNIYYLVGAKIIVPFKDRLVFMGPVVQSSGSNSPIYLGDTIIYTQNGTPYYTCSYTNTPDAAKDTPTTATNEFTALLVPVNQTASSPTFFTDSVGFGGYKSAGISENIITVDPNEDVLIVGMSKRQARIIYTGNDIDPFGIYTINAEYGSSSTFSSITLDQGVLSSGSRGLIITSQVEAARIDLNIPDKIFEFKLIDNGFERITSQRDFINEWVYFSFPANNAYYKYNAQTLQYNYREKTWSLLLETYTSYGQFRPNTGLTWQTVGNRFPTWSVWNEPWNASSTTELQPKVLGGNTQGYIVFREDGTAESFILSIQSISGNTITSPNHCLNDGDYILIDDCTGTIGSQLNGNVYKIYNPTTNTFKLDANITAGTYFGLGRIKRYYVPVIKTKEFPLAWSMANKTRIGVQQYLFTQTAQSQVTLNIYVNQNSSSPANSDPIWPDPNAPNDSNIFSSILYTCNESTNLGLTTANVNLQQLSGNESLQLWHRMNTSLVGDTVQIGITLSDAQMKDPNGLHQTAEIELHGIIIDVNQAGVLA